MLWCPETGVEATFYFLVSWCAILDECGITQTVFTLFGCCLSNHKSIIPGLLRGTEAFISTPAAEPFLGSDRDKPEVVL